MSCDAKNVAKLSTNQFDGPYMNKSYDVYMCRAAKAAPKTITRGNVAACIYKTASDEERKVMQDVYDFSVEHNCKLVINPKK